MAEPPKFFLQLLGSASLTAPDGTVVTGRAAQRHRLAVLALLAAARGSACKREKVMAYLWPESDTERARNLLNVSVYVLRQALGEDAILSELDELRLNTGIVAVDVVDFESACATADYERAVTLYRGPLLDGFFLSDAPDFEHWLDQERDVLAREYAKVIEALAEAAEREQEWSKAVEWWQRRATQDPYDSRVALRLMQAYDAAGNPAGALQHASIHAHLLREDLALDAPSEIAALATAIRERGDSSRAEGPREAPHAEAHAIAAATSAAPAVPVHHEIALPSISGVSPAGPSRRTSLYYGIAIILIAGAVIVGSLRSRDGRQAAAASADGESIAVLPFTNLGNDPADRALADGLTEQLIATLSTNGNLRVIASTSVFQFRDRRLDVRRIADTLGVSNILEGGFQRIGSRLRVQIRLIDARDGVTRWSSTYDRELEDVFAVQDEIAKSVTSELGLRLAGSNRTEQQRPQTTNVAAYELFLRGNDPTLLRTDSGARVGLEYFRQAIAQDPEYAAAHAGLARMILRTRVLTRNGGRVPAAELLKHAEASALRAVELDDELAIAHATLGLVRRFAFDYAAAEKSLLRALALDPVEPRIREWLVHIYIWKRRPQEALLHAQAAVQSDPLSPSSNAELARALLVNNRCDEALVQLRRVAALQPPLGRAKAIAAQCYAVQKKWPQAIEELRQLEGATGQTKAILGYYLAKAGQTAEAKRIQDFVIEQWRQGTGTAYAVAITYLGFGDMDAAFVWLERAIEDRSIRFDIMEPPFNEVQSDPRFERLLDKIGL